MSYATEAEISSEFKNVEFSATTSVKTAEVTRFLAEASALIDAKVGMRYVTPVTNASDLLILKTICIDIVTARIKRILDVKTGKTETEQGVKGSVEGAALKMLSEISNGNLPLQNSELINESSGVYSYAASNGLEHTFKKGEDQW